MSDLTEITLSSEKLLDGKLLHVYRDVAQLPDGRTSVREWIQHPGASAVVALFENGDALMIRQFRYPPRRTFLEVPAGKLEAVGEDPAETAQRELEEETGYRAGRLDKLGATYPCIGYSDEVIHLFLARDLVAGKRALAEGEHLDVVRQPFVSLVEQAQRGEILDTKTAVALLMAAAYLARERAGAETPTAKKR